MQYKQINVKKGRIRCAICCNYLQTNNIHNMSRLQLHYWRIIRISQHCSTPLSFGLISDKKQNKLGLSCAKLTLMGTSVLANTKPEVQG